MEFDIYGLSIGPIEGLGLWLLSNRSSDTAQPKKDVHEL